MAKLEIALLVGNESKMWLDELTKQLDRMEKLQGKAAAKAAPVNDEDESETEDDEEEMPKAKRGRPAKAKAAPPADDEDEEAEETEDEDDVLGDEDEEEIEAASDDDEDEEEMPKAKAKAKTTVKKITVDDVNEAAKAFARENGGGKAGREKVLKIIRKNFGTASLADIRKEDYSKAMKLFSL